ncbi:MAG: FGGY family carbohydrate kinase [Anditalea sp.]
MKGPFFIGIDIGTQGARVVLINIEGEMLASAEEIFLLNEASREEQSPSVWWEACFRGLKKLATEIKGHIEPMDIKGIAVTSTSGTVIPLDKKNEPLHLFDHLPLEKEWLPQVLPSGEVLGNLDSKVAKELNLSPMIQVAVGITDGCASQIASGAINPGDWNTTIGTTMVVKGVTKNQIIDPIGRLYSHRHPMGYWMPGGASNTGADWVTREFEGQMETLNEMAKKLIPTNHISYPLRQKGERFPFIAACAEGFEPDGLSLEERYTANMEGVAYLERHALELVSYLSGEEVKAVYTAGGGSKSEVWLKIRSNVLNLPLYKMKFVSGAVGAAVLAASKTHFSSLIEAGKALICTEKIIYPDKRLSDRYEANYKKFIDLMKDKGYIKGGFGA